MIQSAFSWQVALRCEWHKNSLLSQFSQRFGCIKLGLALNSHLKNKLKEKDIIQAL